MRESGLRNFDSSAAASAECADRQAPSSAVPDPRQPTTNTGATKDDCPDKSFTDSPRRGTPTRRATFRKIALHDLLSSCQSCPPRQYHPASYSQFESAAAHWGGPGGSPEPSAP